MEGFERKARRLWVWCGVLWLVVGAGAVGLTAVVGAPEIGFVALGVGGIGMAAVYWGWRRDFRRWVGFWNAQVRERLESLRQGLFAVRFTVRDFPQELQPLVEQLNRVAETVESEIGRIRKLERVRSDFLGNVSHELRNPLFALRGYLEVLVEQTPAEVETVREFARKALGHARRLEDLLTRLLELSQIESGAIRMRLRVFSLVPLVQEVLEEFGQRALQRDVQLMLEAPAEPVEVVADRERIGEVLRNLVENAIKYNRAGGKVWVRVVPEGKRVRVEVADTGVGIAPEHQERVFERFYRVRGPDVPAVEGTGLGLAIVKHILEAHQVRYELESQPGVGTSFRFWLRS